MARGKAIAVLPPLAVKLNYDGVIFRRMSGFHVDYGVIFHQDHRNVALKTFLPTVQQHFAADRAAIKLQKDREP